MSSRINIRGKIYGNLLALRYVKTENTHAVWKCKCLRCGKAAYATCSNLESGNSTSCQSCCGIILTDEQDIQAVTLRKNGKTITEIAIIFDVSRGAIYSAFKRKEKLLGDYTKMDNRKKIGAKEDIEIRELKDSGKTLQHIAKLYIVSLNTIRFSLARTKKGK